MKDKELRKFLGVRSKRPYENFPDCLRTSYNPDKNLIIDAGDNFFSWVINHITALESQINQLKQKRGK